MQYILAHNYQTPVMVFLFNLITMSAVNDFMVYNTNYSDEIV